MSHGTYLFVMICPRFFVGECWHKYARAMSHVWMRRDAQLLLDDLITHVKGSCHTGVRGWFALDLSSISWHICAWFMSHIWPLIYLVDEWWHKYTWVTSHLWMSHDTQVFMDDLSSNHVTYRVSHVTYRISHVTYKVTSHTHMNESCHTWMTRITCEWVTSRTEWVTSNIERVTSHTNVNESCYIWVTGIIYERFTSHIERVTSHTNVDKKNHTRVIRISYKRVMSHM